MARVMAKKKPRRKPTTKRRPHMPPLDLVDDMQGVVDEGLLSASFAAPVEDNRPRRVVLDNNVPGGFRMEPI